MTVDLRRPLTDPLEGDLHALFGTNPSPAVLERLDRRIDARLQAWDPRASRRSSRRAGREVAIVGLLAAALAIGGATGNLQSLYLLAAGPFDLPWHRGEALDLSQTVDGYRVTIDRAYADATRLALAISVVDEQRRPGITQLSAMAAIVTDEDGEYGGLGATSTPEGPFAAVNVAWKVPPVLPLPSGPRMFKVVIPSIQVRDDSIKPANDDEWWPWQEHAGPWTYEFDLDVDGGTTITPDVSVEKNGVTVHVSRVIAASNIIRVDARIDGAPRDDAWSPNREHHPRRTDGAVHHLERRGRWDGGPVHRARPRRSTWRMDHQVRRAGRQRSTGRAVDPRVRRAVKPVYLAIV